MPKIVLLFLCSFFSLTAINSQELNCTVEINANQIAQTNKQVFETLKTSLTDFINKTQWTNKVYKLNERVDCAMTFVITEQSGNNYSGTLQVNAVRPVFGTSYQSPIFNYMDKTVSFEYTEFEPLVFNATVFESNLISLVAFYVYTILGVDADTFALKGGDEFLKQAIDVANLAQQGGMEGWELKRNQINRYSLIDQLMSNAHQEYREAMYQYHVKGFDILATKQVEGKEKIAAAVLRLEELFSKNRNSMLIRTFFDAKADELVEVFKDGKTVDTSKLKNALRRISSMNASKWQKIK
ncbi:type IX secretion system protein PorD [Flavicella sediminum]|uniref:type IX secretion system protein PorD n=1 Tax=Flavicella sediminum TaxID=2585141 RepID=UPI001124A6CC|nr:DUF4835 family protein [Flavicella sediminum]